MGEELYMGGRETKWGVAIADNILGPYHRSEYNPVTNSGHETCLWQYNGGIAAFLRTDGVEKNSLLRMELILKLSQLLNRVRKHAVRIDIWKVILIL